MMLFDHCQISLDDFLTAYWQRKPLLIRQAFPEFVPELDENDIAGLACDEFAESRLITGSFPAQDWTLRHGPFTDSDFSELPPDNWTLLVQDVEKHYPPLRSLMQEFEFIPSWRIDDLMVSVAGTGGSVGPHVDQYDVFLLQASGERRWQIAESFDPELQSGTDLNVLRRFQPQQEWVLQAGDLLYLPPGVAHHGIAVDQCMTWSIGLRAPSTADLLQAFGEWLATNREEGNRYRDPAPDGFPRSGEVDSDALGAFRQLVLETTQADGDFELFLGEFLSRYRLAREPAAPPENEDTESLRKALHQGQILRQNPWTRLLWLPSGQAARLYAAGSVHDCSIETATFICDPGKLGSTGSQVSEEQLVLLCQLVNEGHLYLDAET